jgi:hypothetical protein
LTIERKVMPRYSREPEADPAVHLLTRYEFGWDEDGNPTKDPLLISEEIARQRTTLADETTDPAPLAAVDEVRALILAAVLEECAARLRLALGAGHPAGSAALADFADELADDLHGRAGLRG